MHRTIGLADYWATNYKTNVLLAYWALGPGLWLVVH